MKKISVIVPVYNVEVYLKKCILSIIDPQVSTDDYELIVVNDGSTDNSRNILSELQTEYPFIQIIDKENGGLSSARNAGLKQATGEYILFIDSDDWIAEGSLLFLIKWMNKYKADIYLFGMCETTDDNSIKPIIRNLSPNNIVYSIDNYLTSYTLRSCAWQGLFARKLFTEQNLTFKEGFIGEDDDFSVRIFSIAHSVVCNNKIIYYYYQRNGSISKSKGVEKKLLRDKLIMLKELDEYVQSFNGTLKQGLQRKMNFLAVDILRMTIRRNHTNNTIDWALQELRDIGYYPLKKANYSTKYNIFRLSTYYPWMVKSAKCLKKIY